MRSLSAEPLSTEPPWSSVYARFEPTHMVVAPRASYASMSPSRTAARANPTALVHPSLM